MEEFIVEMQNNIGITADTKTSSSRLRTLFSKIVASTAEIRIIKYDEDGDIVFEVPMKSVGVDYHTMVHYKDEIAYDFTANVIGELLVRENIDKFAKLVTASKEDYFGRVNKFVHRKFGMRIHRNNFVLKFHASLIQTLLTENFRKTMM